MTKKIAVLFSALSLLPALAAAQNLNWNNDPVAQFKTQLSAARPAAAPSGAAAQDFQLYGQALDGQFVSVPYCKLEPTGGKVSLTLDKEGHVGALFSDADGETVRFSFPVLAVSNGSILYDNLVIGTVSGNQPRLNPAYSLNIQYGGAIDSCTGADRVVTRVFIQGPAQ